MALSEAFDKAALSAASILRGFEYGAFRERVGSLSICISYDAAGALSAEGRTTLDLLTNLLARQYGVLRFQQLGASDDVVAHLGPRLCEIARETNPAIDAEELVRLEGDHRTFIDLRIAVGDSAAEDSVPTVYVGSDRWEFGISVEAPVGSAATDNPFGAAAAACVGAACVFRMAFADSLAASGESARSAGNEDIPIRDAGVARLLDRSTRVSLVSMAHVSQEPSPQPPLDGDAVDIDGTYLVGVGAIGNAALWVLGRTPGLAGTLSVVDHERIEVTNLQRYVLASSSHVGQLKVQVAKDFLERTARADSPRLSVSAQSVDWARLASESPERRFARVLVALDSAEARIAVQGSLPIWVVNAWTQPENIGVSRHPSFKRDACIACLYSGSGARKSRDQLYFDALGGRGEAELMEIRELLYTGRAVGEAFLRRTAERLGVPYEPLAAFATEPVESFYRQALCGGVVLRLGGGGPAQAVEVPLPFQSALAGVLLCAEMVLDVLGARTNRLPCRTEINLLAPLAQNFNVPAAKSESGRCICQDAVFLKVYDRKCRELESARTIAPAPRSEMRGAGR